jgi:hypothetical protein
MKNCRLPMHLHQHQLEEEEGLAVLQEMNRNAKSAKMITIREIQLKL